MSAVVMVAGGVWAGLKSSRALPETIGRPEDDTKVDTALASAILDALPDPVLLLDNRRQVLAANRAADELLGDRVHGRDVCLTLRHPDAQQAVMAALEGHPLGSGTEIVFDSSIRRIYQLQVMPVPKKASVSVRAVVALHEVTALKHVEDMRADFVANVSHELRSPLSTLTGFIETLQTTAKDDAQAQERFLAIMDGEASRMTRLIDDLLSLSRIEVNEHIRPTGRVRIEDILTAVVQSVELRASQKGMHLQLSVPENLTEVVGDRDELRQVMQNLIDNALTYGAPDTAVMITMRALEPYAETGRPGVEVSIQNFGEGISEDHIDRLTERFYRVDKGRSRAMGGTGLGLAIVKHIVNHHRGRLLVASKEGESSTFSVQLPAA
jgi:two-component system phosphate regulon sensor histidine kinase PhoR